MLVLGDQDTWFAFRYLEIYTSGRVEIGFDFMLIYVPDFPWRVGLSYLMFGGHRPKGYSLTRMLVFYR
jgi:hypothetical protein